MAGEAPTPPAVQKLLDTSTEVARKAREAYVQAVRKEQDKLAAALKKEQESTTKKGDLDTALLIKSWVEKIQAGHLLTQADAPTGDLLGDDPTGKTTTTAPNAGLAHLTTDCAVAPDTHPPRGGPKEVEGLLAKATRLVLPKGDATRYSFTCTTPGIVLIWTGIYEGNHTELWREIEKSGFKRIAPESMTGAWFTLEAKNGAQFVVFDAPKGAPVSIFASAFVRAGK